MPAIFAATAACLIWSLSFVIARGVHDFIMPMSLSFMRWLVALIVVVLISRRELKNDYKILLTHWRYIVFTGLISVGLFNSLVYVAAHYTSTHHIGIISSTSPIWTLLLAGFLKIEALSFNKILGSFVAFAGTLVIISSGDINLLYSIDWNYGDVLLLISAIIWAIYSVLIKYKPKELHAKSFLSAITIVGTVSLIPFFIYENIYYAKVNLEPRAIVIYLYLGIFSSVIAWLLWNWSVKTMGAYKTTLVYYSIPIFSSIIAVFTLDEQIMPYHIIGFLLIIIGMLTATFRRR